MKNTNSQDIKQYMCYAAHVLPDESLLAAHVPYKMHGAYSVRWVKPRLRRVDAEATCVAYLTPNGLSVLPLPKQLEALDAPYGLAYDFWLRQQGASNHTVVAQYYGFIIFTTAEHDWRRAQMHTALQRYADALLHADRTLLSLAQSASVSADAEKYYARFVKLRNLALDQYGMPEGVLAAERALVSAQRCKTMLEGDMK